MRIKFNVCIVEVEGLKTMMTQLELPIVTCTAVLSIHLNMLGLNYIGRHPNTFYIFLLFSDQRLILAIERQIKQTKNVKQIAPHRWKISKTSSN